ncbi:MAG: dTDP-4-dehydrorhamnose reductase [Deltaproteobacteria bacterium]|nr:dTDP-4-dehydrorhamnose reductase [Deltaproteobacteria bacterium]
MNKILLTGSAGQLGTDLLRLLKNEGMGVAPFTLRTLDITDKEKVSEAVRNERPSIIINCAAYTHVDKAEIEKDSAFAVNRDGAAHLAEAASMMDAPIIHISTDYVFDGMKSTPYIESDRTNPLGVYGESKFAGEEAVLRLNKRHIIIRSSWLYGAGGHNFVKTILKQAKERESLRVVYDQTGTPTWTEDLARAIIAAVRAAAKGNAPYGIYHYADEGVASWYDFALSIVEEARGMGEELCCKTIAPILTSEYPTPAKRPPYSVFDKGKIKKTFNMTIPHWKASLRNMLGILYGVPHA